MGGYVRKHDRLSAGMDILETMTGLRTATLMDAVRKMSSSDEKCANAIRYVKKAMS